MRMQHVLYGGLFSKNMINFTYSRNQYLSLLLLLQCFILSAYYDSIMLQSINLQMNTNTVHSLIFISKSWYQIYVYIYKMTQIHIQAFYSVSWFKIKVENVILCKPPYEVNILLSHHPLDTVHSRLAMQSTAQLCSNDHWIHTLWILQYAPNPPCLLTAKLLLTHGNTHYIILDCHSGGNLFWQPQQCFHETWTAIPMAPMNIGDPWKV
jgi:hypothetical protein